MDQKIKIKIHVLQITKRKSNKQCLYTKLNNELSIQFHTTIKDIIPLGPLVRSELLPFLGVSETVKASQLASQYNKVIDYNR